jgi:hypothetical protein
MRPLRRVYPFPGIKLRISWRNGPGRNPQNGVEGIHRIKAAVEAKYEFVEVGLQMTRLDTAVMSAIDPRLQVGEDKVDHRKVLFCLFRVAPQRENIVLVANPTKIIIPLPAVSADDGARRYIFRDESGKRCDVAARNGSIYLFDAGDDTEPKTPGISEFLDRDASFMGIPPFCAASFGVPARPHFDCANHRRLMMGAFPFAPRAAAYKAFIYFDGMRRSDGIAVRPNHTGAELVKHRKCCLIGSNIKLALKLESRLAGRLCRHEIGAPKPRRERHMTRLHNCPGSERRIFFTGPAAQHNRRAGCKPVRLANDRTRRTCEAVRPAHYLQITGASAVIRKNALEFRKARWEGCIHV